jgi:hypothetical protein
MVHIKHKVINLQVSALVYNNQALIQKNLGSATDPRQTSQGQLHVLFSVIQFYPKSYPLLQP